MHVVLTYHVPAAGLHYQCRPADVDLLVLDPREGCYGDGCRMTWSSYEYEHSSRWLSRQHTPTLFLTMHIKSATSDGYKTASTPKRLAHATMHKTSGPSWFHLMVDSVQSSLVWSRLLLCIGTWHHQVRSPLRISQARAILTSLVIDCVVQTVGKAPKY